MSNHTVTASNSGGGTTAIVAITVNDIPPSGLTYTANPAVYSEGVAIAPNAPVSSGGTILSYSVLPTLPAGLSLNPGTGIITGTPTTPSASSSFTISGVNSGGSTTALIEIAVNAPPAISSQPMAQVVPLGVTATFSVTASGASALSYEWKKNGASIQGATSPAYTTPPAQTSDNGAIFTVTARDSWGGFKTSSGAMLTVTPNSFTPAGSLTTARKWHTATLLQDGRVLVVGGLCSTGPLCPTVTLPSPEIFDPNTGTFSSAPWSYYPARYAHTATRLSDGRVFVVGGYRFVNDAFGVWALFDPTINNTSYAGPMSLDRIGHTATLLPNSKVLVAGGTVINGPSLVTADAQLFDPTTRTFSYPPNPSGSSGSYSSLLIPRSGHTATLLPNGKVLLVGGTGTTGAALASAELFDPSNGAFVTTGSLTTARYVHTATLLQNGKVLIVGDVASSELYDPATGTFSATGSLASRLVGHTATLLPNGKVLIAGGHCGGLSTCPPSGKVDSAEVYDPVTGTFSATATLGTERTDLLTATPLHNGKILMVGGLTPTGETSSTEIYW